jgi:hypothetical protein
MTTTIATVSDSRIPTGTMWVGNPAPVLKDSAVSFNSAADNAGRLHYGPTLLPVRDNVAYAWHNSSQECMDALAEFFPADYRAELEPHAIAAMETVLPEVWLEHGSVMLPCSVAGMGRWDRDVPDSLYHAVWDEAASRIEPWALVEAARLTDQYIGYLRGER